MKKKYISFILFTIFVIGLYIFQNKAVTPFLMEVIQSPLFIKKVDDVAQSGAVSSDKTALALMQCTTYLRNQYDIEKSVEITHKNHTAWALGDYTYLINSTFDLLSPSSVKSNQKFVCKIKYFEGDDTQYSNWNVLDFTYNK